MFFVDRRRRKMAACFTFFWTEREQLLIKILSAFPVTVNRKRSLTLQQFLSRKTVGIFIFRTKIRCSNSPQSNYVSFWKSGLQWVFRFSPKFGNSSTTAWRNISIHLTTHRRTAALFIAVPRAWWPTKCGHNQKRKQTNASKVSRTMQDFHRSVTLETSRAEVKICCTSCFCSSANLYHGWVKVLDVY